MEERARRVTEAFDEFSQDYDQFMDDTGHSRAKDEVCDLLLSGIKGKVLDVATGTVAGKVYARKEAEVTGVDQSTKMIEIARKKQPGIRFLVAPVEALPFEDNSFDVVICCLGFEWVSDKRKALSEMDRVSKGKIMIMEEKGVVKAIQKEHEDIKPIFKKFSELEDIPEPDFFKKEMSKLGYSLEKEVKSDVGINHSLFGMVFVK